MDKPEAFLRDWFAGQAMQGLIASDAFHGSIYQQEPVAAATFAYRLADAMLAERAKSTPTAVADKGEGR